MQRGVFTGAVSQTESYRIMRMYLKLFSPLVSSWAALPRVIALCSALVLQGCFLFATGTVPTELDLSEGTALESVFAPDAHNPHLYRSKDGTVKMVGIKQCGATKTRAALARTRQLFVGFSAVRVDANSQMQVGGIPVERATISATLDSAAVSVLTYSFAGAECLFDLVLWSTHPAISATTDVSGPQEPLQAAQRAFEPLLVELIPAIVR
ncbi:MAG: hypothetical protein EBZ48_11505 [Proteobacteria bacterium]|nr:hypothetical protein [Pseudomonadota bacterium]